MCKCLTFQRRTKQKVVTDFATVSKGTSAATRPRAALRQVLFNQGVSSDKNPASEERGQLDVLKQDLEAYAVPVSLRWKWKEESRGTTLEKNWTDIVHSHSTMSKMQRHQHEALWELVHTELTYINKLIIIKDLVVAALVNLQQRGFLLEVHPQLLFSNLPSILSAHQLFWQEVIYPMLQEVRRTGQPFDPMRLEAGCLQFHERFSSYQHYCWEEENNLEFTRRQMESNPHFLTYVQWVETHPQCERMRLGDMQAKPHQRITKYPLLLKAVLRNTQDPHVQHTLRGMLSSVNSFLESINDYLKLKDEELALSISAQRVEGYEVEGISEEIDKHVREICQFDLTCPVRGVGPGVVRRLLLEENLKIRDRKDNKLEVVALLFSDVLLMTKVQKKGERLKVVRPPLALDRTSCIALKDGCSFVLVEVGELQSAMNVYIFSASTSESCSTWVSTIHQAKGTLADRRKIETNRQMENWKNQLETKSIKETKMDNMETRNQHFVDQLDEEMIMQQSINGMLASKEAEGAYLYQPADEVSTNNTGVTVWVTQASDSNRNQGGKSFAVQQQTIKEYEWIEMGMRGDQDGNPTEEEEKVVETQMTKDRRVTFHHRPQSAPNLDLFTHRAAEDSLRFNTNGPHNLLIGGLPDVDYPTNERSPSPFSYQQTTSRERPGLQRRLGERGISTGRDFLSVNQDVRKFSKSHSGDIQTSPEVWEFTKNLKSPVLRRRRPLNMHQAPTTRTSKQFSQGSGEAWTASASNSESDYSLNSKRNSVPSDKSSISHRVLKLGSLKPNQGMFWNMHGRSSPDPQTLSEPESELSFYSRKPKMKTQRSASIPNIIIEGGHGLSLNPTNLYTLPQTQDILFPIPGYYPIGHPSPLDGLLERANERKRDRNLKKANLRSRYPSTSPSFSTTPSPSPSDGDRDTEWEEEVELMRHRALTVSKGWKEQLVDGDEDDNRNSVAFSEGVNVDWPGWCFDDNEVMDYLQPRDEGLLEGISRSLALLHCHDISEQEEGECSQV
ncbi:pleckstrin homology domain-containing family G member 5 [Paralichthys olivaceus]|uniref:pleckstrin homology domain-containing family G member 5 n=1 Tax=Paralichthys olivaceus TaxID=8255 RepID=UPI0037508DC2